MYCHSSLKTDFKFVRWNLNFYSVNETFFRPFLFLVHLIEFLTSWLLSSTFSPEIMSKLEIRVYIKYTILGWTKASLDRIWVAWFASRMNIEHVSLSKEWIKSILLPSKVPYECMKIETVDTIYRGVVI